MIKAVIFDMFETLITHFASPVYFSPQIAEDAGIPFETFREMWRPSEEARTTGKLTTDQAIADIMKANGCYTDEKMALIMEKRINQKVELFNHLHPGIIPMMEGLKQQGTAIALITNCYSEEAAVIKKSVIYPYFDVVCMSCEEGVRKPDQEIFSRCLNKLQLKPEECLYIGDGGSRELEAAALAGMNPAQAVWYLKDGTLQPAKRMPEYLNMETPLAVCEEVQKRNMQ